MALDIDILFKDGSGNDIEGSCEQVGKEGRSLVNAFEHKIYRPYNASTGKSTGRVRHSPIKIWKEIDKASPILAQSLYDNKKLQQAEIRFWNAAPDGTENNYYTCVIEGVRIQAHTVEQLHNRLENGLHMSMEAYDVFELSYEEITYTYNNGGIMARDHWLKARRR